MKTFKAVFKDNQKGVYAISLVENPAMEGEFVALSKDRIQLKQVDEKKRLLLGLVLEPNKLIYRNDENRGEYNIVFDEDTITKLSHQFFKKNNQHNSTIEHSGNSLENVTFCESWIVEDPEKDKSANYGFSYPKGSWLAMMKVDNDEVWNDFVETGKVKGYSIDAMLDFEEVTNLSKMEDKKGVLDKIQDGIDAIKLALTPKEEEKPIEVELGSVKSADGQIDIMYDGEELVQGVQVYVMSEDGTERVALPQGEYEVEGGQILVVSETGEVSEIKSAEAPQEEAPEQLEEEQGAGQSVADAMNQIKSLVVKYSEDNAKIISDLKAELSELKTELSEVKEQPMAKPIKTELSAKKLTPNEIALQKFRESK